MWRQGHQGLVEPEVKALEGQRQVGMPVDPFQPVGLTRQGVGHDLIESQGRQFGHGGGLVDSPWGG